MKVLYLLRSDDAADRHLQALHAAGYEVIAPDLPHGSFAKAVGIAREITARLNPAVVVACGRGAAVALAAGLGRPLIVLAVGLPPQAFVLHAGPDDPLLTALLRALGVEPVARFVGTGSRRLVTLGVDLRANEQSPPPAQAGPPASKRTKP